MLREGDSAQLKRHEVATASSHSFSEWLPIRLLRIDLSKGIYRLGWCAAEYLTADLPTFAIVGELLSVFYQTPV